MEYDKLYEETAQETHEARLRSEKFKKEVSAFFEEMEESTKRTMVLAEKCRKEMDTLENLGKKLQEKLDGLKISDQTEQSREEQDEDGGEELEHVDEAPIAVKPEQGKKSPGLSDPE